MNKTIIYWIIGGVVVIALGVWYLGSQDTRLDSFAQCIKDKGATFYGAYWCPHCQNQKKEFGYSSRLLPYVECSMPDGRSQTQVCIDKKIEQYPTWEFADQSRVTGEMKLEALAEKTSCELPK